MSDQVLLNQIKNNPSAFAEIFDLYYKPIFGYVFRRIGDFEETADITSDTFYKALININHFEYRGIPIKVWLYRIASNEINLFFRNQRKHRSIMDEVSFENKEIFKNYYHQDKEEIEAELQNHQVFLSVLNGLKMISPKYQEVISLRYFEGKSNKEIIEILNLKEGTLKSLLSRGLEKLRQKCNENNLSEL